ncbi:unnamed protein product [Amoebophrya sp. A25]|nr:unnamed protein product [Amoebophrya sp. A25]|eukprot:GSA25T00015255001.1
MSSSLRATSMPPPGCAKQLHNMSALSPTAKQIYPPCLLLPFIDEMDRMCMPNAHGSGYCRWWTGGFHKFGADQNLPHHVPVHCNSSQHLQLVRDNRLFREEKKKAQFAESYRNAKDDPKCLQDRNQAYGDMMNKILRPETPPIVRIKRAESAPKSMLKATLKDVLKELHEKNRADKAEIKEKIIAAKRR